jgi:hypothetical protein
VPGESLRQQLVRAPPPASRRHNVVGHGRRASS